MNEFLSQISIKMFLKVGHAVEFLASLDLFNLFFLHLKRFFQNRLQSTSTKIIFFQTITKANTQTLTEILYYCIRSIFLRIMVF